MVMTGKASLPLRNLQKEEMPNICPSNSSCDSFAQLEIKYSFYESVLTTR